MLLLMIAVDCCGSEPVKIESREEKSLSVLASVVLLVPAETVSDAAVLLIALVCWRSQCVEPSFSTTTTTSW